MSEDIKFAAQGLEYWGQLRVVVRLDDTEFTTALFPTDGHYLVPLKNAVRKPLGIDLDQMLSATVSVVDRGGGSAPVSRG